MLAHTHRFLLSLQLLASLAVSCAAQAPISLPEVFERVDPSVVTVRATQRAVVLEGDEAELTAVRAAVSVGSGFVYSAAGEIVTAAHVIDAADKVVVEFAGGASVAASIVAWDPRLDLALLRLNGALPQGAAVAALGDSDRMRIGDPVFVVGAPLDVGHTLTVGYVSARRKEEAFMGTMRFIEHLQTDAAVNKGNSGGPVFNWNGEVVGVVCHLMSRTGGPEGLGFAISSNVVREFLSKGQRVWLGLNAVPLPQELARALNVPDGRFGLLVQRVAQGSLAAALGLRGGRIPATFGDQELLLGGDIILEIQGDPIDSPQAFSRVAERLAELKAGDVWTMTVLRSGRLETLTATLAR